MQQSRRERRRKPDLLQRSFLWLGFISWGLFWLAVFAFNYARPEIEYGLVDTGILIYALLGIQLSYRFFSMRYGDVLPLQ